jgi:hypothetical protein
MISLLRDTSSTESSGTVKILHHANNAVFYFQEKELEAPDSLKAKDYCLFLLTHLIIFDTNNARFLWKRIPKTFKTD